MMWGRAKLGHSFRLLCGLGCHFRYLILEPSIISGEFFNCSSLGQSGSFCQCEFLRSDLLDPVSLLLTVKTSVVYRLKLGARTSQ